MEKAFKFRMYPNKEQEKLIQKTFGCVRYVYNQYLSMRIKKYERRKEFFGFYQCSLDLTKMKQRNEWLKEPDKCALQNALKDLDNSYKNFFKKSGFPKFKSKKKDKNSYKTNCSNKSIVFKSNNIKLPKLGWVKIRDKQIPNGRILNATISQTKSGKYFVSLCCTDVQISPKEKTGAVVGIDLGLIDFIATSDGKKIQNPKNLIKSQKKLVKLQRELSRKAIGSLNRNKARIKLAKQYEHISNQRKDFSQKLSTQLISSYDIIAIEDLNVKAMIRNHSLARSISDASWSGFVRMLEYKAQWYGKEIRKIDRYYPSSQICSNCGHKDGKKDLSIREWICPECKVAHDRDINAAKNILSKALN